MFYIQNMECKCGNKISIKMGSQVKSEGCKILTSITTIVTAQCLKCGQIFQIPINSNTGFIIDYKE